MVDRVKERVTVDEDKEGEDFSILLLSVICNLKLTRVTKVEIIT